MNASPPNMLSKPRLVKLALWTTSLGVGAYLLRRLAERRRRIDVGPVSDAWLANRALFIDSADPRSL